MTPQNRYIYLNEIEVIANIKIFKCAVLLLWGDYKNKIICFLKSSISGINFKYDLKTCKSLIIRENIPLFIN